MISADPRRQPLIPSREMAPRVRLAALAFLVGVVVSGTVERARAKCPDPSATVDLIRSGKDDASVQWPREARLRATPAQDGVVRLEFFGSSADTGLFWGSFWAEGPK